jgi:hypothetical protein
VTGSSPRPALTDRVRAVLADAVRAYGGRPARSRLQAVARHLDEPLRVAIAGRVKAGKSTLLNALVGQRVAATDAGECTRVVTWYAHGESARAWACLRSGERRELRLLTPDGAAGAAGADLDALRAEDLDRLWVELPSAWLAQMTLIDTPGMASLSEAVARRTRDFLLDDGHAAADTADEAAPVDAVLYLLRQLHASDVDFLEIFHEAQFSQTTPVNAVGVLSRADEIGGGGGDAIELAGQVAADYRSDGRIRGVVHTVLPVAGLLAETAATLRDDEAAALAALAATPESATGPILLTAARFLAPAASVPAPPDARRRLLQRLGMHGLRLAIDAARRHRAACGRDLGRDELAQLLLRRSGLLDLRHLLLTQFAERRDVLKAETALRAIDMVARTDPIPAAQRLRQQVEQLRAGAHELAEIRLLTELRTGAVSARPEQLAQMERLLGGEGTAAPIRLGLAPDAPGSEIAAAVSSQHTRWRRVAADPLTDPSLIRAAKVLQRTCEGLAASIPPTPPGGSGDPRR